MPYTISDSPAIRALTTGLQVVFQDAYTQEVEQGVRQKIATEVPSNAEAEDYGWLGNVPGVREFDGERQVKALNSYTYSIKNRTWENTIGIDRAAIDHDKYGLIRMRVQNLATEAARFQDQLVMNVLEDGFTKTCYDGEPFFSNSHTGGDNLTDATLSADALQSAITTIMGYTDDQGNPMAVVPDTLVVPPALQWTARELLESTLYPDIVTDPAGSVQKLAGNVLNGTLDLVVSPYLADSNNWYVLCTKRGVKPLIFQMDHPVEFQALEKESESGFMRAQYLYGTYARYNAGYGLWQLAYGSTGGS